MGEDVQNPETITDEQLMWQAQQGSVEAFTILHTRHRQRMFNYLYRYLGNYAVAEDITQETFLRAYRFRHRYRPTGQVLSWLYRIATNAAKNALRSAKQRRAVSLDAPVAGDEENLVLSETVGDTRPGPVHQVSGRELDQALRAAITSLPPTYRTVLILCGLQGCSYREAADILRCRPQTVGVRLFRARQMLRQRIDVEAYVEGGHAAPRK